MGSRAHTPRSGSALWLVLACACSSIGNGQQFATGGSTSAPIGTAGTTSAPMATGGTGGSEPSGAGNGTPTGGDAGAGATAPGIYVGPDGVDTNAGTIDAPLKTLTRANQIAQPGSQIWMLPGTYQYGTAMVLGASGTEAAPINLFAVPGARPLLDFSSETRNDSNGRGIEIRGNYWHIRGIEIFNAADNGIAISGSHNTVEDTLIHGNGDTGLQITVSSQDATDNTLGAYNLILNVDSYENLDVATNGENADGFAAKLRIGPGNVFRGCRAWNNADDGWDLFAADDVVVIDNCWSFMNGKTVSGTNPAGDGNGFKLGGKSSTPGPGEGGAIHLVTQTAAFENLACGYTRNNNPDVPSLSDCATLGNMRDYCSLTCAPTRPMTITGADAKAMARNADGSLPTIH